MKIATCYNRVERQEYTLSTSDVKKAVSLYVQSDKQLWPKLPANAREEIELEIVDDSHNEVLKLTRRFIYDDEAASPEGSQS